MGNKMQARNESVAALSTAVPVDEFRGYALIFSLMGKLLYANPEYDWLNELALEGTFNNVLLPVDNVDVEVGQELLKGWLNVSEDGLDENAVDDVKSDYISLFVNQKAGASTPPWESIYVNHSPAFFQCSTMGVRRWYQRYLLEVENRDHEPDDHVGLELTFLGHLCAIASGLVEPPLADGEKLSLDIVRFDVEAFADAHLFNWATHWCDIVREKAKTNFYCGAALLTKGALNCLATDLGKKVNPRVFR